MDFSTSSLDGGLWTEIIILNIFITVIVFTLMNWLFPKNEHSCNKIKKLNPSIFKNYHKEQDCITNNEDMEEDIKDIIDSVRKANTEICTSDPSNLSHCNDDIDNMANMFISFSSAISGILDAKNLGNGELSSMMRDAPNIIKKIMDCELPTDVKCVYDSPYLKYEFQKNLVVDE